jgi:hypothetical protein
VSIPGSITDFGTNTFYDCSALTNLILGDGLPGIGAAAFAGCTSLGSVTIPSSVTNLGALAFAGCVSLTNVTFSEGTTTIQAAGLGEFTFNFGDASSETVFSDGAVFYNCTNLDSVNFPDTVTNLNNLVFEHCPGLTAMTVDPANAFYSSSNGVVFDKAQTTLVAFPSGVTGSYNIPNGIVALAPYAFAGCALTNVTIPDSVTTIGSNAFAESFNLSQVEFGQGIVSIGDYAFADCHLEAITIPGSVTNLGDYAFAGYYLNSVYFLGNAPSADSTVFSDNFEIPTSYFYYLPGTTGWSEFSANTGLAVELWLPQIETGAGGFGVQPNSFGFNINWAAGETVLVQACTNLASPVWQPVSTNILTGGASYFTDPQWTNYPNRFYRLSTP